ncbi:chromosomal replication initiator protein DnaA [Agathobaculum sp. NSJ-28]|uniref:Chromosomal replication initiator protein DnaA n=2 Tax=Agathobaculum TaxID=2048137 RepID=A0A923LUM5_9FIRM|nr:MULTISPECIES: chromosomal replication initiator protein DnaA [Butyricicoccaceae]MBS6881687.1 chromosomal replication initiator protein DnaA [Clostridiaceae bacterium]SCI57158.1 Chromosomal replication initiator protein DnaA [uncultured Butyricicoccus sp.]MBC5724294.1 chromosomal replication initiator protein DnaA [Agathobaculum faecis]MCU6788026.1 chromosomal replication initiator protein DnaA [Agathobaculum ammoniilyticum]WOC75412.1 chromosomal replication initiator protein DnaA [Intestini
MANNILEMALERLEPNFSPSTISAWFDDVTVVSFADNRLILHSPVQFKKEIIEQRFIDPLQNVLQELLGDPVSVVVVTGEYTAPTASSSPYDDYTFERFIVGSSNKFAHAAALSVSQHPAAENNPLFIYGNSGLGKTHLMYAIANVIRKTHPEFRIIYVKGEDFTNELITAIQEGNVQAFRNKYRVVDLLLLDDVQFIAGKERTQEEFFHTFNALYEAKKQIVLTSDRPPKEINTLEDRMKTRFEWGLLADIQPPDFETRIAIIRDKAGKMGVALPDNVSTYIAENIQANIRQLEGAVKKIKAMHELMDEAITIELAENAIDALRTENPGLNPTPERIMEAVANYFYIPVEQMISQNRSKDVAYPRQMAMYMIRQELEYSFPDIAKIFKRDHTTVMHACNKIEEERKNSRETEDVIKKLHNNIRGE